MSDKCQEILFGITFVLIQGVSAGKGPRSESRIAYWYGARISKPEQRMQYND